MSDDGADLGVTADRALKTVLGGKEQPAAEERKSPEQMREWLMSLPRIEDLTPGSTDYGDTAGVAGRAVLEFLEAHPEHRDLPLDAEGEFQIDGRKAETWELTDADGPRPEYVKTRDGLYDVMKAEGVALESLDLTGFMWGWAGNAARYCLDLPAQPNPAIVEVNVP